PGCTACSARRISRHGAACEPSPETSLPVGATYQVAAAHGAVTPAAMQTASTTHRTCANRSDPRLHPFDAMGSPRRDGDHPRAPRRSLPRVEAREQSRFVGAARLPIHAVSWGSAANVRERSLE